MTYIADLHIHSLYSRATSKASNLFGLAAWAAVKGLQVVGTGDCTHPGWFAHLVEELEPAEPGLFRLKTAPGRDCSPFLPPGLQPRVPVEEIRFVLSAEISSIYKRGGQVRKVHNLLYLPDFEAARHVNATLATLGNIASDGRPILGLDSRNLLEILLEKAPDGFLVPAHIWTPWFSLFGSKSGFDAIEECFGDLSDQVFALETGLSSDPEMNRLISALDRFTLISNSDCHSPSKLGREANIFNTERSYYALREALRSPVNAAGQQVFAGTIEFYPEEGKYHCDGHRKCQVCLEPRETDRMGGRCPACGKPLTIGVLHRVMDLADRQQPVFPPGSPRVHSLIPLEEILAELLQCGPTSKKVSEAYVRLINLFGSEFSLLLDTPEDEIRSQGLPLLAEAIARVRTNRVLRRPGFDGEFGVITVFADGERASLAGQSTLFGAVAGPGQKRPRKRQHLAPAAPVSAALIAPRAQSLNEEQQAAVVSTAPLILVQAGPGTGKTHTLVSRVRRLAAEGTRPCTVITFTNKAADEIRQRLQEGLEAKAPVTVATFHGYCLAQLRRHTPGLQVVGPEERSLLLEELFAGRSKTQLTALAQTLSAVFRGTENSGGAEVQRYLEAVDQRGLIDIEAVVPRTVTVLAQTGVEAEAIRAATGHLLVDEFQDVNAAQYALMASLARTSTVFAIGDPDQAIYGFRGADPQWLYTFLRDLQPEVHHLVRNYRSGATIIRAAEACIANNTHPWPSPSLQPCAGQAGTLHRQECATVEQEAQCIAEQIEIRLGGTSHRSLEQFDHTAGEAVGLGDIAVLYRTGRQAERIAKALAERSIPFQLVDLEAPYTKGDGQLLYAWLLLLAGRAEPDQVLTLLRREPELGSSALQLLRTTLRQQARERGGVLAELPLLGGPIDALLAPLQRLFIHLQTVAAGEPVAQLVHLLIDHYHLDAQQPELRSLYELTLTFGHSLVDCAAHLHRFSDSVLYDPRAEAVTLSTLHAAKGLEFPVVFMAGCEEGLLPLAPHGTLEAAALARHVEEERRLFYVGLTRAIISLTLTWSRLRSLYGGPAEPRQPSRFLHELPAAVFSPLPKRRGSKRRPSARQLPLFS